MMNTPILQNEDARLAALATYDILDTPAEEAFDGITRIAAALLDVPVALVSMVDADRQWFKSSHGLRDNGLRAMETPRDVSFCAHVVAEEEPLIVSDARDDKRFVDNPLVTGEPRIRFYAGMPLRNADGFVLGALCAIDHDRRINIPPEKLELLHILSQQVVDQLELRRAGRVLQRERTFLNTLLDNLPQAAVMVFGSDRRAKRGFGSATPSLADQPTTCDCADACLTGAAGRAEATQDDHRFEVGLVPVADPVEPLGVALCHSITERDRLRDQLARQQRLVTTGKLAASISRELNNPLTFMIGNLDHGVEELRAISRASPSGRTESLNEVLVEVRDGAERIRRIVRGLRAFARAESQRVRVDLHRLVDVSIDMSLHELRHTCTVLREFAPVPRLICDEAQLSQVLVNLLINAGQCFPERDPLRNRVTVRTRAHSDGGVLIVVNDNGPGIEPDVLPRIFDPFFTTSETGRDSGLGLSISQNLIEQHGGTLTCQTKLGEGSEFQIRLPPSKEEDAVPKPKPADDSHGRVLMVDDEPTVLRSLGRLLKGRHEVVLESDPREALKRLEAGEHFDVVFCDLTMPHIDGMELYSRVSAARPELAKRFVFISGGVQSSRLRKFLDEAPNQLLDKPVGIDELRRVARRFVRGDQD